MARHLYHCPLRWSDMDAFGHVNNAVYFRYLEEARIDLTFRLGPEGEGGASFAGGSVVARHEIDYLRPLVHRYQPVIVETWVKRLGAASVTYAYEIRDQPDGEYADGTQTAEDGAGAVGGESGAGRLYARATTVVVPYDLAAGRPRRLTSAERELLSAYLEGDAAGEQEAVAA